jgi:hypothetical protein
MRNLKRGRMGESFSGGNMSRQTIIAAVVAIMQ